MALPKTDSFTAADQDLSTYNANWFDMFTGAVAAKLRLVSNAVAAAVGSGDAVSYYTGETFTSDQRSDVVLGGHLNYSGPVVRGVGETNDNSNQGYMWLGGSGQVFKISGGGGFVQIASGWTIPSLGDTVRLSIIGTQLTGYINGVSAGTVSDATYTGGSPGLYISGGNGATLDSFVGDNEPPTSVASCAITGTATASITEADVRAGGKTIIATLTGDTFVAN